MSAFLYTSTMAFYDKSITDTLTSIARRLDYAAESDDTRAREHLLAHLHRHGQHDLAHRLSALNRQGAS